MQTATKEQIAALFPLAACASVSENPHQGYRHSNTTLHQAIAFSKPLQPPGLPVCQYDFRRRSRCTGKERDAETGLDYFGARYFSGAQGRFTSPDPKVLTARHLTSPQKWNKYAYVQNNPLAMVDPNGEDDYYIFRPTATSVDGRWPAIQAAAQRHGDRVIIYNGKDAMASRYTTALSTKDAHVVFSGHTLDDNTGKALGVNFGDVSVGDAQQSRPKYPIVATPDIQASSVGIFACSSVGLQTAYSTTLFTGIAPSVELGAEDVGAQLYTATLIQGGTIQNATSAAQLGIADATNQVNVDPSVSPKFQQPTVTSTNQNGQQTSCSTQPDGTQKCK